MQNATIDRSNHLATDTDQDGPDSDRQFSENVIRYKNQVEDIITWIIKKEEELQKRQHESSLQSASFNQILDEYSKHEKFMIELCEYCHVIMKCKEEGQEMRDCGRLSDKDSDEVGIQMDTMMVYYEKLKILTTDRLQNLQTIIEDYQQSKIERFEEWLNSMEKKMASSNNIGPDYDAIRRQIKDIEELRNELLPKQDYLNFISKFIIFDEVDTESLQIRSRSCESIDKRLESMNQRWTSICRFVDDRNEKLRKAESIWKLLHIEGLQLAAWLKKVETRLDEISEAARSITDPQADKAFISELMSRSEKIDSEIRSKQTFYTSLENRVRVEIERFEDPCSMLVIELDKTLEDMQYNWDTVMKKKRMLDYTLQALSNPMPSESSIRSMIPLPDPITSVSNGDLRFNKPNNGNGILSVSERVSVEKEAFNEILNNSFSSGNDDRDSSLHFNGSLSDPKALDNSLSSGTRSLLYGSNHDQPSFMNDNDSQDGLSSTTNLTSPQVEITLATDTTDDASYSCNRPSRISNDNEENLQLSKKFPSMEGDFITNEHSHNDDGAHSCRVEEWKHSLESFSNWLKQVETSLGMEGALEAINEPSKNYRTWSQSDLQDQISLVRDIENRIESTCQDEFDCLLLQGQQIIEDLIPEIGENEYEANLKEILTDIEIRYGAVKRCLADRKREIADKEKWRRLSRKLRDSCDFIIHRMSDVIPETNIGIDLITIAQQQDQLMHLKDDIDTNTMIHSSIEEAKLFLRLCDSLQQQYGQQQGRLVRKSSIGDPSNVDIWLSFEEFRENIEDQLDKLTLHYSELSQLIEDRLAHLDEVHKEMHALQHRIQELATKLQVAEILKSNWVPLENLSIEQLSEQLEDLKLYRERLCEIESIHKVMNSIFDWMAQSHVPLSQSNLKRIGELNTIWNLIEISVEQRQKLIEQAFDEQSGSEQKFLDQTVADLPRWERRVATSKVPYFIDHESNKTLWDHPKFTLLLNEMSDFKQYVFSVYRTAMKLRIVQRRLGIDMLMLEHLKEMTRDFIDLIPIQNGNDIADEQAVQTTAISSNDTPIGVEQIILLLKAIYGKIQSEELPTLDVPLAIDLTLNWLLNLYDS